MIVQPSSSRVNSVMDLYCCWLLSCQFTIFLLCLPEQFKISATEEWQKGEMVQHSRLCEFQGSAKLGACTWANILSVITQDSDHRWGSEQRSIQKLTALRCLKAPFCDHRAIKLTQNCVCFTNPCINFHVQSLGNTTPTPRHFNFSPCCSVLPLTHVAENRLSACWRRRWGNDSSTKSSSKSERLILQLQLLNLRRLGCDCMSYSYNRLRRVVVAAHTFVGVQHPLWTVVINSPNMDTNLWAGIQWLDGQ